MHHILISMVGFLGLSGFLSPTLDIVPQYGVVVSLSLVCSGLLGLYARLANVAEIEIIALRMMCGTMIAWGLSVVANVILGESTNIQGALVLISYGVLLWALAQGVYRGLLIDLHEIEKFILVILPPDDEPEEQVPDA